jgi:ribosomal protein L11 methyltransferase
MEYIEIQLYYPSIFPGNEVLPALLCDIGFDGFMEMEDSIKAYIPQKIFSEDALINLLKSLPEHIDYDKKHYADTNWNAVWESDFEPVFVTQKCMVRAPFHQPPKNLLYDIVIEPRMTFGTAHHETTFMMLQFLLNENVTSKKILDMGCGTGVIAILAEKKGAAAITAIDNDEWAYHNTIDNIKLNQATKIKTILGDASILEDEMYDVIFANINRNILLRDMEKYHQVLNNEGIIFFSGFYENDIKEIQDEAEKNSLKLESIAKKNNWSALKFRQKNKISSCLSK